MITQKLHSKKLVITGELPDMNTYINFCRSSKFKGGAMKKEATETVYYEAKSQLGNFIIQDIPVFIEFHWYCKNKKKDKDNVCAAKKFILDGLQMASVILQDNWNAVEGFSDYFYIDAENPRIEIIINY